MRDFFLFFEFTVLKTSIHLSIAKTNAVSYFSELAWKTLWAFLINLSGAHWSTCNPNRCTHTHSSRIVSIYFRRSQSARYSNSFELARLLTSYSTGALQPSAVGSISVPPLRTAAGLCIRIYITRERERELKVTSENKSSSSVKDLRMNESSLLSSSFPFLRLVNLLCCATRLVKRIKNLLCFGKIHFYHIFLNHQNFSNHKHRFEGGKF